MPQLKRSEVKDKKIDKSFLLAEYQTLREEILKRIELRHQIVSFILITAGSFFTLGTQLNSPVFILLIYPTLAMLLLMSWTYNNNELNKIEIFIRENLEAKSAGGLSYYIKSYREKSSFSRSENLLADFGVVGIVAFTQLIAIIIVGEKIDFSTIKITSQYIIIAILIVDYIALLASIATLYISLFRIFRLIPNLFTKKKSKSKS